MIFTLFLTLQSFLHFPGIPPSIGRSSLTVHLHIIHICACGHVFSPLALALFFLSLLSSPNHMPSRLTHMASNVVGGALLLGKQLSTPHPPPPPPSTYCCASAKTRIRNLPQLCVPSPWWCFQASVLSNCSTYFAFVT